MERKKYIFVIGLSLILHLSFASSNMTFYKAYISGDLATWKKNIDLLEKKHEKSNADKLMLINYHYAYIAWCIDKDQVQVAQRHIDVAWRHIQYLEKRQYEIPQIFAYKAAFKGFEIGLNPYKAPFIGPDCLQYARKSVQLDPDNALGYIQLGNIEYYKPKAFGGSKEQAIKYYRKALTIMEKNVVNVRYDWNYLNLLATLIDAYKKTGKCQTAKSYCEKTLRIAPEFGWVKDALYPDILKMCGNG